MACGFCATRLAVTEVEPRAFRARAALLSQLRAARARGEQAAEGSQVWLDRLLDTFDVGDAAPAERILGAWDAAADAKGAHVVAFLSGRRQLHLVRWGSGIPTADWLDARGVCGQVVDAVQTFL